MVSMTQQQDTNPYPWLTGPPPTQRLRASRLDLAKLTDEYRASGWWCSADFHTGSHEASRVARVSTGDARDLWLCDDCVDALIDGTYRDA